MVYENFTSILQKWAKGRTSTVERVVFDRMAELDQEHWWFLARRKILASAIRHVVAPPKDARILEIGCGTGHNLEMLQQFGHLDACEMDAGARDLASLRLGRDVADASLPALSPYGTTTFDMVALLDVLEHIDDDGAALKRIHDVLKIGGALLVTVPANEWMWSSHDVAHHHHRRYTRKSFQRALTAAGFEIQYLTYFNTILFPLIALVRGMNKVLGRHESDDALPSSSVNRALKKIFSFEAGAMGRFSMPFGVSLLAVVRRAA